MNNERIHPDIDLDFFETLNLGNDIKVIDTGSHRGQEIEFFLPKAKKIFAFEPHLEHFCYLNSKYGNNDKVDLFCAAVFSVHSFFTLFIKENNYASSGSSLCPFKNNISVSQKGIPTITVDIAEYLKLHKKIDFFKVDTEGVEYEILARMLLTGTHTKVRYIYVEDHSHKILKTGNDLGQQAIDHWYNTRDKTMQGFKQLGYEKVKMKTPTQFCLSREFE